MTDADDLDLTAELDAAEDVAMNGAEVVTAVTEHAHQMSGGGYHVWNTEPYIEEIYPLEQRIAHGQQHGGEVYRRQVIVVEDWTEIGAAENESAQTAATREDEGHGADH